MIFEVSQRVLSQRALAVLCLFYERKIRSSNQNNTELVGSLAIVFILSDVIRRGIVHNG